MIKVFMVSLLSIAIVIGCYSCGDDAKLSPDQVQRLDVVPESFIYGLFESSIFTNQGDLDIFIDTVKQWEYEQWVLDDDMLISILSGPDIDLTKYNLVLYRHYEYSGSNKVSLGDPYLKDNIVTVDVDRDLPIPYTNDTAYYCYAVLVAKSFDTIKFKVEDSDDVIFNLQ